MSIVDVFVLGSLNLDVTTRVRTLPQSGETVLASGLTRGPGGKGLNQAVAAARAGARVRMSGCVGCDPAGEDLIAYLRGCGVDVAAVQRHPSAPTGHAFITIGEDGENCIVVASSANLELQADAGVASAGARVVLVQLETALAPVTRLFRAAPPSALKVLNAAPYVSGGRALMEACDIWIVNETELAAYAGQIGCPGSREEIGLVARDLLRRQGQVGIVSLGAAGALLVQAEGVVQVEGRRVVAVDTVGAGDCFCGVFAAGLAAGRVLTDALLWANCAASLAVTRPGSAEAMPASAQISAAIRSDQATGSNFLG